MLFAGTNSLTMESAIMTSKSQEDFFSSVSDNNLRQSGGFDFKFASMCDNYDLFNSAFSVAKAIIDTDSTLSLPEHEKLRAEVDRRMKIMSSSIS